MRCMQWDHEPTPNPSQEGIGQDADECLLPSWEGSGVGRFMESLLSLLHRCWDHEPERAKVGQASRLPAQTGSLHYLTGGTPVLLCGSWKEKESCCAFAPFW